MMLPPGTFYKFVLKLKAMTRFSVIFLCLLLQGISVLGQEGVSFFKGSWKDALDKAKKERKLIFVDAYTVWCGPCKAMNRNTFPNREVGEFFNENFVNYKFDMEKGEGPSFAENYRVSGYPTLLFINFKGDLVHRTAGYRGPKELIVEGRRALDPAKNADLIELAYESGERDPETLFEYAKHLHKKDKDYRKVAGEYFATQTPKELVTARNWEAIQLFIHDMDAPEYQYLLKSRKNTSNAMDIFRL